MTTWGNVCRICSSPADYEIFAKIPTYLHGSTNEFLNWQKPINQLLEETTGLKNSPDDGLPRYICAPCISYLKHAVTFREQCIKNALSLKLADLYQEKTSNLSVQNKESALFTAEDLSYVEQRPVHNLLLNNKSHLKDKVDKQLLNQQNPQYLKILFDQGKRRNQRRDEYEEEEEDSSDDNEQALLRKHKNCYNYSETNFEEDDPMEQAQLRDIKVNIPEPMWKERKCPACSKRFMFEESHQTHLDNCVEYQFVTFVMEMTKLLEIRRQKMVSPHEFIRRMIFALHKTCTWLQEHSIDTLLAEKLKQVKITNNNGGERLNQETESNTDFDQLCGGQTTPITMENNVLYAIARSESRNSQVVTPQKVQKPIPIRASLAASSSTSSHEERVNFLEKLQRASVPPPTSAPSQPALIFSARCGQCNLLFDSVTELEIHNIGHHNGAAQSLDEELQRRRIIALFEDDI